MWSVTPYPRCSFRCVYCVTSAQGESATAFTPASAAEETRRRLAELGQPRCLLLGAFSDAYPPEEAEAAVTRAIVEVLVNAHERFTIITKGDVVLRDLDLLLRAGERCLVQISLSCLHDDVLRQLDLHAPSGTRRLEVVDELHRSGVPVAINALPWIPGITDAEAIIERVPADVDIVFSPLAFGPGRDSMRLLQRRITRDEVWAAYLDAYESLGHHANTSWVQPSMPPNENHPLNRLPQRRHPPERPDARMVARC